MSTLYAKLEACASLPTMPGVAVDLLKLCRSEDCDLRLIGDTLTRDPALAAKMLRTANSSTYKRRMEVKTVHQAASMLGSSAVLTLALSFSLVRTKGIAGFDHAGFWARSLFSAVAARSLAKQMKLDPEQLFLAGLIQDLGMLAMANALPEYAKLATDHPDHEGLGRAEYAQYGTNHGEVTAWLARRWRLPEYIADSALGSHQSTHDPSEPVITRCVAVSRWIASIWLAESAATATRDAALRAAAWLDMDRQRFQAMLEDVVKGVPELGKLLEIEVDDAEDLEAVATDARTALAAVSFRADSALIAMPTAIAVGI